jgi:hypothetical protein
VRTVVAVLALVACVAARTATAGDVAGPAATAGPRPKADPAIGRCVKRVRTDRGACMREAVERCRTTFEANLVDCYGSAADCARGCIASQARCRAEPQADQDGCKLACSSDEKVARGRCKIEPDIEACQQKAKMRGLECKQACVVKAEPRLRTCMTAFDRCLGGCAGPVAEGGAGHGR